MPLVSGPFDDELGAHVSAAGGVDRAPARALEIGAVNLQLFTKSPSRWADPPLPSELPAAFRRQRELQGIRAAGAHDSYLINLASPDTALRRRSLSSFVAELQRCTALGLSFLVTHPGNATDGDRPSGLARNAEGLERALEEVGGAPRVLLELTAGTGHALGSSFEELAEILAQVRPHLRRRLGVCLDTCHAYSAGYDLAGDYAGVLRALDDTLGLDRLELIHLNDSKTPFASRRDRHEHIGRGSLGLEPFRRLMLDERLRKVPKLLETPKEGDPRTYDRRNLELLRGLRV